MFNAKTIIDYWFGGLDNDSELGMDVKECMKWHSKAPEIDEEIKSSFEKIYLERSAASDDDLQSPEDFLAQIILFDQFPRNMYRESEKMYATDERALNLCYLAMEKKLDLELSLIQRLFFYMPLMHSENVKDQEIMLKRFKELMKISSDVAPKGHEFFKMAYGYYAVRHHEIVARFGRFPHRNSILNRQSTPGEVEFLKEDNSSF